MLEKYEAVIFDLDGTLVDSMWIWEEIDKQYVEKAGFDIPDDIKTQIEGMSFTETATYFKEYFQIEKEVEEIIEEWNQMAFDFFKEKVKLKPGAFEFVKKIKESGMKIGVGTSNSRILAETTLKSNKIYDFIDVIRTSCEVKKGKPNPDVFLKVAEDLKVSPKKCLVFEDTYAGVMAGHRAGMDVCGVEDSASIHNKEKICKIAKCYIRDYIEIL